MAKTVKPTFSGVDTISVDDLPAKWTSAHGRNSSSKYGNQFCFRHGLKFHSVGEANRWDELLLLQAAGQISKLERQVDFLLTAHDVTIGKYIADFFYIENGIPIAEDFKGASTALFRWKRKHFEAEYKKITFRLVQA